MSVQQLSALYEQILESASLSIDSDGLVQHLSAEQCLLPVRVTNRSLYVPSETTLRMYTSPDKKDRFIAFHPLSESILRTQSPMIKWLRPRLMHRLQAVMGGLLAELASIAADTSRHKGLSPKATEFLSHVPDLDLKMSENMNAILNALDGDKHKLINIYLKQGGNFDGKVAHRSAIVTFPFLSEFDDEENNVFGVKLRKKDRITLKKFFLWLLPNAEDVNAYSFGSTSATAPYFHALINAYVRVASRLNAVTKIFAKHIENSEELHIDINWSPDVIDLTAFRDSLPPLSGNEGELNEDSKASQRVNEFTQTQAALPASVAPSAPVTINKPVATGTNLVDAAIMSGGAMLNNPPTTRPSEYKPFTTLGVSADKVDKATAPGLAKPNNGDDLEQVVMARMMGFNNGFGAAGVPRAQMSTNFPWLQGYQANIPMGGTAVPAGAVPGMMPVMGGGMPMMGPGAMPGGVMNLNAMMPQAQVMPVMMGGVPMYPNGTNSAPNLGGAISTI